MLGDVRRAARCGRAQAVRRAGRIPEDSSEVGRRGGESGDYEDWTVDELHKRAKVLGISGYSGKKKAEVIRMLRNH